MIEILSVTLTPSIVTVGQSLLVSAEVVYTQTIYTWGDLTSLTWDNVSAMTWRDIFPYMPPDYSQKLKYSGTFYSGQDFNF